MNVEPLILTDKMKKRFFYAIILCSMTYAAQAQLGVGYHLTFDSFFGFSYQIKDKFLPEIRLSTNTNIVDVEATFSYIFQHSDLADVYAGLGISTLGDWYVTIPVGINVYPFKIKNFGFHMEAAPMILGDFIFRGSFGIRYRFIPLTDDEPL